jgi:hypothetical protein
MNRNYFVAVFSVFVVCSCTNDSIDDLTQPADVVTYTNQVRAIIETNCIGCHGNTSPLGNLSLTNYNQTKNNINNIIDRIQRPQGATGMMPLGQTRLPEGSISIIKKWRDDGLIE